MTAERHPLAARGQAPLAKLAGVPIVAPHTDRAARPHRELAEQLFAAAGLTPNVTYDVDDLPAAQALARAGLAAALMHGLTIPDPHPGIAVRRLADGTAGARTIEVASLDGRQWPPADATAAILLEQAANAKRRAEGDP